MQKKLSIPWINRLFMRLHGVFGEKWLRNFDNNKDVLEAAKESWSIALGDMTGQEIADAINYCDLTLEWPPTPAQFRKFGKKIISEEDALQAAIRRDFSNPVVKIAFDKIGSWDMSHMEDKTLRKRWSVAYRESVETCQTHKIDSNTLLSSDNFKVLPSHRKDEYNATGSSSVKVSGIYDKIYGAKEKEKEEIPTEDHFLIGASSPWWSRFKYDLCKRGHDKAVYWERRKYLCALSESQVLSRSRDDQYDRVRYLSEDEAKAIVDKNKRDYEISNPDVDIEKSKNDHRNKVGIIKQEKRYND